MNNDSFDRDYRGSDQDDRLRDRNHAPRRSRTGLWIGLGVAGAAVIVLLVVFFVALPNSVTSDGNKQETALSATYADGANYLSNCVNKTNQAANVATANAQAFDKVIGDAVAGSGTAGAYNLSTSQGRSGLYAMLVQAYPDLKGQTDQFNQVMTIITGCQDDFRNKQSDVLDHVRSFNSWRTGSWTTRTFGSDFPNDNLSINLPGLTLHGQPALDKMSAPIVNTVTANAYQKGTYDPTNPFATASPSSK